MSLALGRVEGGFRGETSAAETCSTDGLPQPWGAVWRCSEHTGCSEHTAPAGAGCAEPHVLHWPEVRRGHSGEHCPPRWLMRKAASEE